MTQLTKIKQILGLEADLALAFRTDGSRNLTGNALATGTTQWAFRATANRIFSPATGELNIESALVRLGLVGTIELGDGTLRTIQPQTDLMENLGSAGNRFNDLYTGGTNIRFAGFPSQIPLLDSSGDFVTGGAAFGDLKDVVLTAPATDQIPQFNGSNWINVTLPITADNYIGVTVNDTSTASANEFDIFDENNYQGGVLTHVVQASNGIVFDKTDGTFLCPRANDYDVTVVCPVNTVSVNGNVDLKIKVNGVQKGFTRARVITTGDPTIMVLTGIYTVGLNEDIEIFIDGVNSCNIEPGLMISIREVQV